MLKRQSAVLWLALLLAMSGDSWGQSKHPPPSAAKTDSQSPTETQSNQQKPTDDRRGTDQFPSAVKIVGTEPKAQSSPATNPEENSNKPFDWGMLWQTVVLGGVGLLQLAAFVVQACYMRTAANEMRRSTHAAIRTARASQKIARGAITPLIGIEQIDLCEPDGSEKSVYVRYKITNYGSGVAVVNVIRLQVLIGVWRSGELTNISDTTAATWNSVLTPGRISDFHTFTMPMLTDKDLADIREDKGWLRVNLDMTFRDVFKTPDEAQFSFAYDSRLGRFVLAPRRQQSTDNQTSA